jgi:NhaA family Na+:H+ antiporter
MALFFFVVGLEIKREVLVGELSNPRQAALPIAAAIGGMVVPALIYYSLNEGNAAAGWGIPMATDIAFAVGILVLLGKRAPTALMTFLVALAIVDDLGAVIVIALFYTEQISWVALGMAGGLLVMLLAFNRAGIRAPLPYFIVGMLLWLAMLKSGIHATLAGVLTALTIPAWTKYDTHSFSEHMRELVHRFDANYHPGKTIIENDTQRSILQTLENGIHKVESPLQRLEHTMHLPVAFIIIPLFAFANAGIPIDFGSLSNTLAHPVTLSVMMGLIAGKFIGIAGVSGLMLKTGLGQLPAGTRFSQLCGVSLLAGIGFTMSIFIAELAFAGQMQNLLMAKTGILLASLLAGIGGYLWLRMCSRDADRLTVNADST